MARVDQLSMSVISAISKN